MPLLLSQDDLHPLFASTTFYPELFQVIRDALLQQHDNQPGVVSWLAFPTSQPHQQINLHLMTTPVEGTSIRIFPHRVGVQAPDSMFTLLFDDTDGHLLALISLDELGPLRTSAPVAFACQYLAPEHAHTLAVIGSGLQARYHVQGIHQVLPSLREIRVYSPTAEHRQHFAEQMQAETGLSVIATESTRQALAGADVVAVTAASGQPIFDSADVQPGALVTSISARALPPELSTRARLIVPSLTGPVHHLSGWDPFPFRLNGGLDASKIDATLVDIMQGKSHVRQQANGIVLYEQSGSFAWDSAMTRWLYNWGVEHHAGTSFSISSHVNNELSEA